MPLDNDNDAPQSDVFAEFKTITLKALQRGLTIHPVKPRGKEPLLNNWPKQATKDPGTVCAWAVRFPTSNYGVAASDEFCILESDNIDELRSRISKQLPTTYMVQAREGRPHIYFRQTAASRQAGNMDSPGIFEFKQVNRYVVGEGSIHPSGAVYACVTDEPIVEIPDWLLADLQRIRSGSGMKISAPVPVGGEMYGEGEGRHPMLMSAAARMWDGEMEPEDFYEKLHELNVKHCNPPKSAAHLMEIIEWIMARSPAEKGPTPIISGTKTGKEPVAEVAEDQSEWGVPAGDAILKLKEMPKREVMLWQDQMPVLHASSVNQIYAWRGLGKTNLALGLAGCFARGDSLVSFRARKSRVVYIDGELPLRQLYERAELFRLNNDVLLISPDNRVPVEAIDLFKPNHTERLRDAIKRHIGEGSGVVILDSQSTLMRGDSMKTEFHEERVKLLSGLRWMGHCVIEMHHSGKDAEKQRGSSKNDDILDVQVQLTPPPGWEAGASGLMFDWNYIKTRDCPGGLEGGFTITMKDGKWYQQTSDLEAATNDELQKGTSIRKISELLDISTSTVQKYKRKLTAKGLLKLNDKADKLKNPTNQEKEN